MKCCFIHSTEDEEEHYTGHLIILAPRKPSQMNVNPSLVLSTKDKEQSHRKADEILSPWDPFRNEENLKRKRKICT